MQEAIGSRAPAHVAITRPVLRQRLTAPPGGLAARLAAGMVRSPAGQPCSRQQLPR